jgi:predicted ATPase
MITQLKFHNFRILQDATLPLGRVTAIIGPNGSGKSTALEGIKLIASLQAPGVQNWLSVNLRGTQAGVSIEITSSDPDGNAVFELHQQQHSPAFQAMIRDPIINVVRSARVFALDAVEIAKPCPLQKTLEVGLTGGNLPSVLTTLQDQFPERFEALNQELQRWMPEFDRILLDTVHPNHRAFMLRTVVGRHSVPANHLSQGNLIAVALLTLSHLPDPPSIIGLEEIDRGIHPRLLRDLQDAVNRLAYPEDCGDDRKAVQVVMTTHSPYLVDLFRDYPEDIVIAEKNGLTASFHRLVDMPHAEEILREAHLGDAWFSGVLGGVPAGT